jgi:hypothetical protein
MTGMSVVKRKGGDVTPPKSQTPQVSPNVSQVEEDDLSQYIWEERGSNVYKINEGDEVWFKPLSEPRPVKNGGAWVVPAYVDKWKDKSGKVVFEKTTINIYMQKVLATAVQEAINVYGIGNFAIHAINEGKDPRRGYYKYRIWVGRRNG